VSPLTGRSKERAPTKTMAADVQRIRRWECQVWLSAEGEGSGLRADGSACPCSCMQQQPAGTARHDSRANGLMCPCVSLCICHASRPITAACLCVRAHSPGNQRSCAARETGHAESHRTTLIFPLTHAEHSPPSSPENQVLQMHAVPAKLPTGEDEFPGHEVQTSSEGSGLNV